MKGLPHGQITQEDLAKNSVFTGEFYKGKKHGSGLLIKTDEICHQHWKKGKLKDEDCVKIE